MADNWDDIAEWWRAEVEGDPAYRTDVNPILRELCSSQQGRIVDLGCGEGQGMRLIGGDTVGVDLSVALLREAKRQGPVVAAELPDMNFFRQRSFDHAVSVYLVDLIEDHAAFFRSCAKIVKPLGTLVIVINHPIYTAPESQPVVDEDGVALWQWGTYRDRGSSLQGAGGRDIRFHHRPLDDLLTSAADAGWCLEAMMERGLSQEMVERFPSYRGQEHIPRLLGVRWVRSRSS